MKRIITALVFTLVVVPFSYAKDIAGVEIDDSISAAGTGLQLNGAGIRTKWFMDIYVGALYLPNNSADAVAIISADEPQAIKLHMVSGLITSDKMVKATTEGFVNATGGKVAPIQDDVDAFMDVFKSEEIKENDVFDLVYLPGKGVEIYKNGQLQDTIGGLAFKKALFGIWLSDKPVQKKLKASMLGD
ncbi:MAG: chalcone isomerase [Gammaproteobacteria bacterium]|nr:MAG: chalcone isomerase [Gammaproteobacteria bacterium]